MHKTTRLLLAGLVASTISAPALSQDAAAITPEQVTTRIDLAAKQRMLIERMAKSLCFADAGVHVWDNELFLQGAYISFESAHRGMGEGDEKRGLFADDNREFTGTWKDVDLTWVTLSRIYDDFVEAEEISPRDFGIAMELTDRARDLSDDLVIHIRTAYTRFIGQGGLGSSILLDLYSRQKELTQRLSKEVCLVSRQIDRADNLAKLQTTLQTFQVSLDGFRNGIPAYGIAPPPTERIAKQLTRVNERWEEIRLYAEEVADGGTLETLEMWDFEFGIDQVLREVERAVFLLSDHLAKAG